ncbi:hypothetical protein AMATHDRAFT_11115 [Amanita thiersii Skay4041]|uniref:Uncharacterized protein n=1 Tax=Amanita thiersii Skay4041 TaxID=703135 RepID=A0A2A9N7H4_9AGAR|nr:hypothetical protein AMATHDRAFT_11115 [Amanita thiersii Skay4041]
MSTFYQAITLLNAGANKWPLLISIYLSQNEMKDLDFNKIKVMFIADWHTVEQLPLDNQLKKRKFHGGRHTKKKANVAIEEAVEEEPSHVLSFAASAMLPHYTSQVSTIDSRPSASPQKYQGTPTKGAWETVPEAISLLHRMGIKPSIQLVKTTEEPLLESANDFPTTTTTKK